MPNSTVQPVDPPTGFIGLPAYPLTDLQDTFLVQLLLCKLKSGSSSFIEHNRPFRIGEPSCFYGSINTFPSATPFSIHDPYFNSMLSFSFFLKTTVNPTLIIMEDEVGPHPTSQFLLPEGQGRITHSIDEFPAFGNDNGFSIDPENINGYSTFGAENFDELFDTQANRLSSTCLPTFESAPQVLHRDPKGTETSSVPAYRTITAKYLTSPFPDSRRSSLTRSYNQVPEDIAQSSASCVTATLVALTH